MSLSAIAHKLRGGSKRGPGRRGPPVKILPHMAPNEVYDKA